MLNAIADRGPQLMGVNITFLTMAVIASLLRCYVRRRMVKAWGVDDWLMSIASIFFVLYCISSLIGIHYGTGRHHADLAPADIQKAKMHWWCCYLFYCITMISSKLSIGWFLLRIAHQRVHRMIIYVASLLTGITGLVFFLVTIVQCSPVEYFWNQYDGQVGHCMNIDVVIGLAFVYSGINVFVDFSFALLPAFLVWGLKLDKKIKLATIPLLTMGCVASGAVVARLGYLMNLRNPDFLWATLDIAIWSTIEQGLTITAGSLAALRPLMRRVMQRFGWNRPSDVNYGTDQNAGSLRKQNASNGISLSPSNFDLIQPGRSPYTGSYTKAGREKETQYPPVQATDELPRVKSMATGRGDSQEGLWIERTSSESLREIEAGVVVTKSWRITVGQELD